MNEEQKEIAVEQQQKKKSKALPIILILLIIALLAGGGILATQLLDKEESKTEQKEENKEENKEESENPEELDVINMDEEFLGVKYTLTIEDRDELLNSTNIKGWSGTFDGAMYESPLSNEFKLFYTLNRYTFDNEELLLIEPYDKIIELKASTIETMAKTFFAEFTLPTNITKEMQYRGIYKVECTKEKCNYQVTTSSLIAPWQNGYMTKPEINGNVVTVKPIYTLANLSENPTNTEILEIDLTLYNPETMEIIKEITNYVSAGSNEQDYDILVANYTSLKTYKYTFTEDFKLVSIEKE